MESAGYIIILIASWPISKYNPLNIALLTFYPWESKELYCSFVPWSKTRCCCFLMNPIRVWMKQLSKGPINCWMKFFLQAPPLWFLLPIIPVNFPPSSTGSPELNPVGSQKIGKLRTRDEQPQLLKKPVIGDTSAQIGILKLLHLPCHFVRFGIDHMKKK